MVQFKTVKGDSFSLDLPETATVRSSRQRIPMMSSQAARASAPRRFCSELPSPCGVTQYDATVLTGCHHKCRSAR